MLTDSSQDAGLIASIARGDAKAFGVLFERRRAGVYRYALHMTGSPSIAEDVTQEVFLAVMRDAGRYDASRATVSAWLCGIARNHVLRRLDVIVRSNLSTTRMRSLRARSRPRIRLAT
jgi:RNA polymerase sigma-70 factor, ECF subfamily